MNIIAFLLPFIIVCGGIVAIGLESVAFLSYTNKSNILDRIFHALKNPKALQFLNYTNNDCKIAEESINKLEKYRETKEIEHLSDDEIKWFYKHVDGSYAGGKGNWVFIPKKIQQQEGTYYSVIEYPAVLRNAVPHSPVTFAPTALIASGIFSTFLGISNGTSGVDAKKLSDTGIALFSSLQHVFFTSLLGLFFATTLIILIAVLTKQKEKYRNNLRGKLNDIAITITPEKLLSTLNYSSSNNANQELENVAKSLKALSADTIGDAVAKAMTTHNNPLIGEIKILRQSLTSENSALLEEIKTLRGLQEPG